MANNVRVHRMGVAHFYARCTQWGCGFTEEDYTDRKAARSRIKSHVKETGHTVRLEEGVYTEFYLDEEV